MPRRFHAVSDLGKTGAEAVEVDEGAEESGNLNVRLVDEDGDKRLETGNVRVGLRLDLGERRAGGSRRRRSGSAGRRSALDNVDGLLSDVGCGGGGSKVSSMSRDGRKRG